MSWPIPQQYGSSAENGSGVAFENLKFPKPPFPDFGSGVGGGAGAGVENTKSPDDGLWYGSAAEGGCGAVVEH